MEKDDPLYNSFNLKQVDKSKKKSIELIPADKTNGDRVLDDVDEARTNTKNLLEMGEEVLENLKTLTEQSEDSKVFGEFSKLLKVLVDANESLVNTAKDRDELVNRDGKIGDQTINNNLFVGSTTEAIEMLKRKREEENKSEE